MTSKLKWNRAFNNFHTHCNMRNTTSNVFLLFFFAFFKTLSTCFCAGAKRPELLEFEKSLRWIDFRDFRGRQVKKTNELSEKKYLFCFYFEKINCHLQLVFESFWVGSLFYLSWQAGLFCLFFQQCYDTFQPLLFTLDCQLFPSASSPFAAPSYRSSIIFFKCCNLSYSNLALWCTEILIRKKSYYRETSWLYTFSLASVVDRHFCSFLFILVHVTYSLRQLGRIILLEHLVFSLYTELSFAVPLRN